VVTAGSRRRGAVGAVSRRGEMSLGRCYAGRCRCRIHDHARLRRSGRRQPRYAPICGSGSGLVSPGRRRPACRVCTPRHTCGWRPRRSRVR
jgi:hypothetical protein